MISSLEWNARFWELYVGFGFGCFELLFRVINDDDDEEGTEVDDDDDGDDGGDNEDGILLVARVL